MEAIEKLSNSLNGMTMEKLFEEALKDSSFDEEVIKVLINFQFKQGIDGEGEELPEYAEKSVIRGKPPGSYLLYDSGDFYASVKIELIDGSGITIYAETEKNQDELSETWDLQDYTENKSLLRLNEDSLNILKPELMRIIKFYLLRKMLKKS
jgi:hypothetical protein